MGKKQLNIDRELELIQKKIEVLIIPNNEVDKDIKDFLIKSSKRIRSKLAILYLKSNNCEITEDIINVITAGEIIHNASLLHDDVIDQSEYRRGKKTLGSKYSSEIAVLAGDLLLSVAVRLLLDIGNYDILQIFLDCTRKMSNAEINQYLLKEKMPKENEYIGICEGKTASLFEAVLECIAILSNMDSKKAKDLAYNFGILFQIKNDLEPYSAKIDANNQIKTVKDIFGVEKTSVLIDNYKQEILNITREFENQIFGETILDLVEEI